MTPHSTTKPRSGRAQAAAAQATVPADGTEAASARTPRWPLVAASLVVTVGTVLALSALVQPDVQVAEGLPDAGPITRWGLPLMRGAYDIAAVGTLGWLAFSLLLRGRLASEPSTRSVLAVTARWAFAWAGTALALMFLTLSDIVARPVHEVVSLELLSDVALTTDSTRALLSSAWLAALAGLSARAGTGPETRLAAVATAVAAVVLPLLTGHAGHERLHTTAQVSISLHVVTACVWMGGLLAMLISLRKAQDALPDVLPRYSRLALLCFVGVGLSGAISAWTKLTAPSQLWSTTYGLVLLVKIGAFVLLAAFGWWHRRRTIAAVRRGAPRVFLTVAAAEILLLAATVGVGAALSQTSPPTAPGHPASAGR